MAESAAEWLERQADRASARQRAQVDTAKLLVTFATAVSATVVATALQVGEPASLWDKIATALLGACALLAIIVLLLDRLTEGDHAKVLQQSALNGWSESRLVRELRKATITAVENNSSIVITVRTVAIAEIIVAVLAGTAGAASLLDWKL